MFASDIDNLLMNCGFIVIAVGLVWKASRYASSHPLRSVHLRLAGMCGALWIMRTGDVIPGTLGGVWSVTAILLVLASVVSVFAALRKARRTS